MNQYTQSEEDYLEALLVIDRERKIARVKDVAHALDVKMPSVVSAVKTLSEKGLVEQEKYGHIELTKKGRKVAEDVYERHQLMYAFLHEVLGLDASIAEQDACRMEHQLSPETRERLLRIVEFIRGCPDEDVSFLHRFMYFVNTGERPGDCQGCKKTK